MIAVSTGSGTKEENKLSATAERFCRQFSLAEVRLATEDFNETHLIGNGGFGKVYKGQIDNGQQTVAIKRLAPNSNQGEGEFLAEIEILSKLRHVNLVSLFGYCNEKGEMILVYEYIARGTLAEHLYKFSRSSESDDCSPLTWKQRLNLCIGVGRGIDYLHTGSSIIHRDVKSTNILIDENFTAKVSDFGLAKHLSTSSSKSHVSTIVKGSFGYLDPSYFITCRLTRKSDIYAFGVVLLEVLCGRPAVDAKLGEDEMSLAMWAREKISKRKAEQIVDSNLRDEISADCLKTYVGIAMRCLNHEPKKRPTMGQVVVQLEFGLGQQDDRKAPTLNALRFLPFWNRVKPSGSHATETDEKRGDVDTLEEALKDVNMLPVAYPTESGHSDYHNDGCGCGAEELEANTLERKGRKVNTNASLSMQTEAYDPRLASQFYKDFTEWLHQQGVKGTPRRPPTWTPWAPPCSPTNTPFSDSYKKIVEADFLTEELPNLNEQCKITFFSKLVDSVFWKKKSDLYTWNLVCKQ